MTDQSTTDNDAAIAQALAREEEKILAQESGYISGMLNGLGIHDGSLMGAYPGNRWEGNTSTDICCPEGCPLSMFEASSVQKVVCNVCQKRLRPGERVYSCVSHNYDLCERCKNRAVNSGNSRSLPQTPPAVSPFPQTHRASEPHMCNVPCVIGEICVEMMVDSGAQSSVISLPLARQLGLGSRIDTRERGVAAGVGTASITGKIRNVICYLGEVEFDLDFIVLDVNDRLLLLGLDLLRRYKCIIDLENERLVFGGSGGVAVPMMPPSESSVKSRALLGSQDCSIM
mmetsp:Transcript_37841/g.55724  ORF Transcript_37841/g.55724 Transcript_37841/m.55724 type:complete len:286 (+) Transcript_37841:67-924(+)|eukprot:CAMPEP_0195522628 /NCGR_PEP_ID=MMETSP0794_2-20130614/20970_1 /TAXON_ID=515487 /ORGANISM="Stephanopyxis turris, Strain CCMP 815" /LENGTH=285 /DNA_ID=CAMNT_0040652429 /DNA_START=51 /DNA_END=908 /DNA_ORIENTATION=+